MSPGVTAAGDRRRARFAAVTPAAVTPALEVTDVAKSYGALVVLRDVRLAVDPGEAVGVVGPNGAGKTTLLDLLTGTGRCDTGRVRLYGTDVTRLPPPARARLGLGRTFQLPHPLGDLTVFENALVGAMRAAGLRGQAAYDAAYQALVVTGMARHANTRAGSLRLLDRKRLELARALAMRPRLLLLDEIAGGFSDPESEALIGTIRAVNARHRDRLGRACAQGPHRGRDPAGVPGRRPRDRRRLPCRGTGQRGRPRGLSRRRRAVREPGAIPILEITGLDVRYGDFQALFGVSLSVPRGHATALVGANGAGKTTLLRAIAGAQPAAAGTVRYAGLDITAAPPHRRISRGIALVPEGRRLFPSLTVEENIQVGAAAAASEDWPLDRIYQVFPLIARRRKQRAATLSGGEQQAVAIARALAAAPSLLLLDEISLGLAPRVVGELYQTLAGLRASGATLLIVEQDLRRAMDACDDLVCLLEGKVVLAGQVASVSRDQVVAAYFGQAG